MTEFLHGELTYYLRGVGFRVHSALKGGHAEKVYEDALVWTLEKAKIVYQRQPQYIIMYKGKQIGEYYPDLVFANGSVIVDLKATAQIEAGHKAQVLAYMAVASAELGFIMNFGAAALQTERLPNFMQARKPLAWQAPMPDDILWPELTNRVIESLHIVQHELGPGFLSQVYRRAARIELTHQALHFVYLKELTLRFENHQIATVPTRLLLIEDKLLLATVAVTNITHQHTEKMRWAMQETNTPLGLIANFYPSRLDLRFLRTSR